MPTPSEREEAADFLHTALRHAATTDDVLPEQPAQLLDWMVSNTQAVHAQYHAYLQARKDGAPRQYFANRAHALYFLRQVAPTKLVDGAWLYGLCAYAGNARLADLVTTYIEELGEGQPDKNHVKLYRTLLASYGLDPVQDLDDALYAQGLVQLALGWNAADGLPEIVGFNLGYEQLPLHLLITAYELNELAIDPYYFTLHVTVDNADTGHAKRACVAALQAAPRMDDGGAYWRRVRASARLNNLGVSTLDVIHGFDMAREVQSIFTRKCATGRGAHSDFCKVSGRSINDWLSDPQEVPALLQALEQGGWIRRNQPVQHSRFWQLLQGERAEMFGVFSPYELQVVHDWIRGAESADGASYQSSTSPQGMPQRQRSFRVEQRLKAARQGQPQPSAADLDTDLALFEQRYPLLDAAAKRELLVHTMSPALHWTPAGLKATRLFIQAT